ncbi:hypothetical protein PilKf_02013 [Pillotina sp. SPG140]
MADRPQLTFINFKAQAYILIEGKQDIERFFIIQKGHVRLSKEAEVVSEEDMLGPGDFFGVVSAMSGHPHIESALAATDVTLIAVQKSQYEGLIVHNAAIAMKIIQQFSRRMRHLDHELTKRTLIGVESVEYDLLLWKIGQFYEEHKSLRQALYAYQRYVELEPKGIFVPAAQRKIQWLMQRTDPQTVEEESASSHIYKKDAIFFLEGEPGDKLFIIKTGSVRITKIMNDNEVLLAMLKPGDIFGEMALLESKPRSASAIAHERCTVMVVNRENFQTMTVNQPRIIVRLTQMLAERIWLIYRQLQNTLITDPIERIYNILLMQAEKERASRLYGYTFNFGPKELATMAGIAPSQIGAILRQLDEDSTGYNIVINDEGKIHVPSIEGLEKDYSYHHATSSIKKARKKVS